MTAVDSSPSTLAGVRYRRIVRHADDRGSFRELWRASEFGSLDPRETGGTLDVAADREPRFVQANVSVSAPGVLRGLHYHRRQLDYWVVLSGRAFVALVDVRAAIETAGAPLVETRELASDESVVIPAGVAHGFLALERLEVLYLVTNEYDGGDELGFAWNDPAVGVPWPTLSMTDDGRPVLSERDRTNPALEELLASLRG